MIEYAIEQKMAVFPGACTPTELMMLLEYNLSVAKFFPAAQFGGLDTIKALSGPFPHMRFMPTGGINAENIKEYLANPKISPAAAAGWLMMSSLRKENSTR